MSTHHKNILDTHIKSLFSLSQFLAIDPFTGIVYDSLHTELLFNASEKLGVIQIIEPNSDFAGVLKELPVLHYN